MTYRYFYKELQWKFKNSDGSWVIKNPPLPEYVAEFSPVHFVKIWAKCHSMNDVHRLLFWLTREEIENYFEEINIALQECEYEQLKTLQYQAQGIFSDEDFLYLEDNGYIKKSTYSHKALDDCSIKEKDTDEKDIENLRTTEDDDQEETSSTTALYNQMQKKCGAYDPLRHVFTTELGKFSVGH